MKRVLAVLGLLFGVAGFSHAGIPVENYYMGQPGLSNTSINVSSASTVGSANLTITVVNSSSTIGGGTTGCRICFTKYVAQISSTTVFQVLDGGTTIYTIDGADSGVTPPSTFILPEDHLGPMCLTVGNTALIKATQTATGNANHTVINAEGYTYCGGTANAGPMQ